VGEQFSAVLRVSSQQALKSMPLLLEFDPKVLQAISVQEGDFFKQNKAQTNFSQRVDPGQGKVFVALVRQSSAGNDVGINGSGDLVTVNFRALKPAPTTQVQVLSATPEPVPGGLMAVPVDHVLRVVP
jgi:general secretion pathway protein D